MGFTPEQADNAGLDMAFIDAMANQESGTVANRMGVQRKTIGQVIVDLAAKDVGAGAAALINQRIQGNTVPQLSAVVNANAAGGTTYTLSLAAPSPFTDGSQYDFMVPAANLGPVTIKLGANTLILYDGNNTVLAPGALPQGAFVRMSLNLGGARFNLVTVTPNLAYAADVRDTARAAKRVLQLEFGVPIAAPISDNVNNIGFNDSPAPANQASFEVIILQANTGSTYIYANGPYMRIAHGGSGTDLAAGELVPGTIVTLTRSDEGGGIAVLGGSRILEAIKTKTPIGSQDSDLLYNPWGNVGAAGAVSALPKTLVAIGSSNFATGYVNSGSLPSNMAVAALDDGFVGTGITFPVDLQAVQGAPWSSASGQLQASTAFMNGTAKWVLCGFWMNDARSIFYHDNGGVQSQLNAMAGIMDYIRSKGAEPIVYTGFHPDPRASPQSAAAYTTKALDPFYFSDTAAYPTGGSTRGSAFSPSKATPVSPTADMRPAATDLDFMVKRDWSGGGALRTGFKNLWHVNRGLREICAVKNVVLLDGEVSCFRFCNETVPDLDATLDTFYTRTNPLHPLDPMYQLGMKPPLVQWARHVAEGRNDRRVFTGF
jgi:hypothetical protein